jgi:beta-xylosidase
LDYRIEQLTESVRFYVSGVLVAEHSKVMPAQSDVMVAAVRSYNPAVPASSTTVVVDFMTVKNHNKLEIGVMSETERIVAAQPPMQEYTYNVAGVIAINTVLMRIDCSQIRSLYIQCVSMGTTGVVTPEWSNNGVNWVAATLITETGASGTTFNAAGLRATNVRAKYFQLRLSTATTAGTTTIVTEVSQMDATPIVATQPVSGTVTATVTSTRITPNAADGHTSSFHLISAATTNDTLVLTGAHALGLIAATNSNAAIRYLKVYNKATAPASTDTPLMTIALKPGETTFVDANSPIRCALGIGIRLTTGIAVNDTGAVAAAEHAVSIMYT